MEDEKLKFYVGFSGEKNCWYVNCAEIDYELYGFNNREDAYHHAKKSEYEFNLIREKHRKEETK